MKLFLDNALLQLKINYTKLICFTNKLILLQLKSLLIFTSTDIGLGIESMIIKNGLINKTLESNNLLSFFELNNGCICCTVKDSLLITLEQLILHKSKFDSILIECTGLANPGPIVSMFWSDSRWK